MSRQNGESVKQYVSRRRLFWTLLVQMDREGHRSDMLLDLSGLTREKRVMVQASISNERDFDRVADALIIQHPHMHIRESQRRAKCKGKDVSKRGDNSHTRCFRRKGKSKHTGPRKSGASAYYANFTSVEDYDYDDDMNDPADAYQAHNDPVDPGRDDGEVALDDDDDDEENDTFSSHVALDDLTVYEAADTWENNLDPEVSAQVVQATAQAYLSFGKEQGKGQGKGKNKGRYPVRPSHLSLEDRRRRLKELKAKTECHARGREGHWAQDRQCSTSSTQNQTRTARMSARQHLSNQVNQVGMCFVLNDYSDHPDISAKMVGLNVPLQTESAKRTPMTWTASAAVDIKKDGIFDVHAMDDNDETWLSETDHRTGWNKEFKKGTYRGMLYGIVFSRLAGTSCITSLSKECAGDLA